MYALANVLKEGPNVSRVKQNQDFGALVAILSGMLMIVIAALAIVGVVCWHRHNQPTEKTKGAEWTQGRSAR